MRGWKTLPSIVLLASCITLAPSVVWSDELAVLESSGVDDSAEASSPEVAVQALEAKWVAGLGRGLEARFGTSRVSLHGYAWLRADSESTIGDETDLEATIPVARLFTTGELLDSKLGFFAQFEFAGDQPELLDLFAEWRFCDAATLRLGQFRTPYSRAWIAPLTNLALPTRGLVVDRFNLGRDSGAMLSGGFASGFLHYDLAIVNGAEINDLDENRDSPSVIARTELRFGDPIPYDQSPSLTGASGRGLTLGLGGAYSRRSIDGTTGTTSETLSNVAIDAAAQLDRLSVRAEGFWRGAHGSPRVANAFGAYGQLGVFVLPRQLEIGGRVGWVSDGPDVQTYEAFVAGYLMHGERALGHHAKLLLGYRHDTADPGRASGRDIHLARLQLQLFF